MTCLTVFFVFSVFFTDEGEVVLKGSFWPFYEQFLQIDPFLTIAEYFSNIICDMNVKQCAEGRLLAVREQVLMSLESYRIVFGQFFSS